jgi:hypothetical protein
MINTVSRPGFPFVSKCRIFDIAEEEGKMQGLLYFPTFSPF